MCDHFLRKLLGCGEKQVANARKEEHGVYSGPRKHGLVGIRRVPLQSQNIRAAGLAEPMLSLVVL